jgi:hypothetical protein
MSRLLKLVPNVPVEVALSRTDGINVVSPRGTPAVKYTLVDGRTFFATAYVDAKFKKMKIGACERVVLCMRNIDSKSITVVERVPATDLKSEAPKANISPTFSNGAPLHDPNTTLTNELNGEIANKDDPSAALAQPIDPFASDPELESRPQAEDSATPQNSNGASMNGCAGKKETRANERAESCDYKRGRGSARADFTTRESSQDSDYGRPIGRTIRGGNWLCRPLRPGVNQVHGDYGPNRHAGK